MRDKKWCCGKAEGWWEMRWRKAAFFDIRLSLSPLRCQEILCAHGSLHCHRNLPFNHNRNLISCSWQRVLIACRDRPASAISKAHLLLQISTYQQQPSLFSFFTPPLFISTFPTFSSPLAQLPFYRSFFFISPFLFLLHFFLLFFFLHSLVEAILFNSTQLQLDSKICS